jgi:hypothetical protein
MISLSLIAFHQVMMRRCSRGYVRQCQLVFVTLVASVNTLELLNANQLELSAKQSID